MILGLTIIGAIVAANLAVGVIGLVF